MKSLNLAIREVMHKMNTFSTFSNTMPLKWKIKDEWNLRLVGTYFIRRNIVWQNSDFNNCLINIIVGMIR